MHAGNWELSQSNMITFVMISAAGVELTGLGATFGLQISKAGAGFLAGAGVKAEIGLGWYQYTATPTEANTPGPVSVVVTGAGAVQQNLEYVVISRALTAIEFTYTVTDSVSGLPLPGVRTSFSTDISGVNIIWTGITDAFGVARDDAGKLPRLDPGTYYVWRILAGYTFIDPDTEIVS